MATVTLTSDATSIVPGQSITFNLVIPFADVPHPGAFVGGVAFFYSGDGQEQTVTIGQDGGTTSHDPVVFTYTNGGDYVASVSGDVLYDAWVCNNPTVFCGPYPATAGSGVGTQYFTVMENITVAAVPEPGVWALLLVGFVMMAAKRRFAWN